MRDSESQQHAKTALGVAESKLYVAVLCHTLCCSGLSELLVPSDKLDTFTAASGVQTSIPGRGHVARLPASETL